MDVRNTPCAREAFMYGIGSGLLVAAAYFTKTSKCTYIYSAADDLVIVCMKMFTLIMYNIILHI